MRRPAGGNTGRQRVSRTYSIPAPTRGWNARDSIAAMAVGYAGLLKNIFPTSSDVILRQGMDEHATGMTGEVETLMVYRPPSGNEEFYAAVDEDIFDVSSAGAVGAAEVTGLTNARWQYVNMTNSAGNHYILLANGADLIQAYNGSVWSEPAITGVTSSTIVNLNVHKERLWMIQVNSTDAWYLATQAIAGAATKFPLGSVFKKGGSLIAMASWTNDGGTGPDDFAVFISSEGEAAVYQGTDPASSETWGLVGVYNIGKPIGYRSMMKFAGDILILTTDGIMPASKAFLTGQTTKSIAYSDAISGALADVTNLYSASTGWQMTHFPEANMILLNVPIAIGLQEQYVMNSTTRAWCQFTGWFASCMEVFNGELYYGLTNAVNKAWTGTSDNGANIEGEYVGAFDYFGTRDGLKHVKMIRPVIGWDSNPAEFFLGVDADFIVTTPTGAVAFTPGAAGLWDAGQWDAAIWGGTAALNKNWYTAFALGYALAPHLIIRSSQAFIRLAAIDFVFEKGGIL